MDFNIGRYDEPHSLKSHLNIILTQFEDIYGAREQEEEPDQRFAGIVQRAFQKQASRL